MTSSDPAPQPPAAPVPMADWGTGIPTESRGRLLQRGGDEILLEKLPDRFVALPEPGVQANWQDLPGVTEIRPIPGSRLEEFVVDPAQRDRAMDLARASGDYEYVSHIYSMAGQPGTKVYPHNELAVVFEPELEAMAIAAIVAPFGLELDGPIAGVPNAFVYRVTERSVENPLKIANDLIDNPSVLSAEPDVLVVHQQFYRPSDTYYDRQWYLDHAGGSQLVANSHIDSERAWDITLGNRSVVVALADDGVDLNHPDFKGSGKIVAPRDFKDDDFVPQPSDWSDSHGTACAGVAIAEANGTGIVGTAPGCALMPIRTTGFIDDRSIEALFDWCITRGAAVISCSWGASSVYFPLSTRQRAAVNRAATQGRNGKGCVVVFASGNANRPVNGTINEQGWTDNALSGPTEWLSGFAVHPDAIAVSASTSLNRKAAYSNWGVEIDLTAPSNNAPPGIWLPSTGPTLTGPPVTGFLEGLGVFTTDRLGEAGYGSGDFTGSFGGTSSACPVVAGVAALVLSANPNLTAAQVRQVLQETADKIVDNNADPQLGFRYGTYDSSGRSRWFGYGKVNAYRAVLRAKELGGGSPSPSPGPSPSPSPGPSPSPSPGTFPDIQGHWAQAFIEALLGRGIISGFAEDGTFRPDDSLTRAQYAAILSNAFSLPYRRPSKSFWDVPVNYWAAPAIDKTYRMGFLSGYAEDGSFRPTAKLTRTQAIVALVNGLALTGGSPDLLSLYDDRAQVPDWARDELQTATDRRMVVNYPNLRLFRPLWEISRAEVCAFVYQALVARGEAMPIDSPYIVDPNDAGGGGGVFSDIAGHWAEPFIEVLGLEGLASGFADGTFRPDRALTRAEFAAALVRAFNPAPQRPGTLFIDVPTNYWAYDAIQQAYRGGFLAGIGGNRFGPADPLSRLQAIVALVSGLGYPDGALSALNVFYDRYRIPTWAEGQVAAATERQMVVNYPDLRLLHPLLDATRGEMAAFIHQALVAEGDLSPVDSDYIVVLSALSEVPSAAP